MKEIFSSQSFRGIAFSAFLQVISLCIAAPCVAADAPPGMRWIPIGEFSMGTDDLKSLRNERPAHIVTLDGFWIDEHDVTNAEFRKFVEATSYLTTAERPIDWEQMIKELPQDTPEPSDDMLQPGSLVFTPLEKEVDLRDTRNWWTWTHGADWRHPQGPQSSIEGKDDHPVVQISWDDAATYATWAGKRLPTEAEWEYAARGGLEKKRFPWGDEFRPGGKFMANTYTGTFPVKDTAEDGFAGTSPVKSFPPNGYGLYDMGGNVWNWCIDFYADDVHARAAEDVKAQGVCCNPTGPFKTFSAHNPLAVERVTKGGSFLCNPSYCESYRPSARRGSPLDTGMGHIGFRCAKSAEADAKK